MMKNSRSIFIIAVLLMFLFCTHMSVFASVNKNVFQYYKTINVQKTGYIKVPVDGEMYDKTKKELSDIRIYNDLDEEVSYAISYANKKGDTEIKDDVSIVNKSYNNDKLFFTVDRKEDKQIINKMEVVIDDKDYLYSVKLEGSNDSIEWFIIPTDGYLHDLNQTDDDSGKVIKLEDNNFRYLNVTMTSVMGDLTDKEILGIRLAYNKMQEVEKNKIQAEMIEHKELEGSSSYIIDTKYNNTLFDKLKVVTSDTNFNRNIEVFGSNNQEEWQRVKNSQISVYKVGDIDISNSELEIRPSRFRYIKVNIVNNDNAPLDIKEIEVFQTPEYLIFETQSAREYRIFFGNDTIQKATYDIKKVLEFIDVNTIDRAYIGGIMENQQYSDEYKPLSERFEYLIWIVIVAMVIALGYLIVNNLKKIEK